MPSADLTPATGSNSSHPSPLVLISAAFALLIGLLLRLAFFHFFPQPDGDVIVYSNLATNLLHHGQLALSDATGHLQPSLIRLPGYPLFLALCFRVFGVGNALAVAIVQSLLDSITCLLLADLARLLAREIALRRGMRSTGWGAALLALWIAELCPFTAIYVSAMLTEGPTLFCIALACWAALRFQLRPSWSLALLFTAAITWAALLRPDGALVAVAFAPTLFSSSVRAQISCRQLLRMSVLCVTLALLPFTFWSVRNWRLFHVFQPLAPRYASDPGESEDLGFEHWMGTWTLDFVNTVEVYWQVPDGVVLPSAIPSRAWSTEADHQRILALLADYNRSGYRTSPGFNAQLERIARVNLRAHPWRTALEVPALRVMDMWLRPRVENLPIDLDWWVYAHHHDETVFSACYAGVNLLLLLLGFAGLAMRPRLGAWILLYMILRSLLLATVQGPEARYTLECLPMLIVTASVWLSARSWQRPRLRA